MRVAIVTWSYDEHQGISRCVVELSARLARQHEVHIYAADVATPARPGVQLHPVPLRFRQAHVNDYDFFFRAGRMLRRESYDLVHAHFPVWYPTDVYTCHGMARMALRSFRRFPADMRRDVSLPRMLRWYSQVPVHSYAVRQPGPLQVAVSQKVALEVAEESGRPVDQIAVIANGVDLDRFNPEAARRLRGAARHGLGIGDDRFVLLWVGNSLRHKGMRHALDTLARLPASAMLIAVGADTPANVPELAADIATFQAQGRLTFMASAPHIETYYASADALLFPSLYESFGLVVLEAMAMGLPVVTASTVALADEALVDRVNGIVVEKPWHTETMATGILELMNQPALGERLSAAACRVARRYTWERYSAAYEAVYAAALSARGRNGAKAHAT